MDQVPPPAFVEPSLAGDWPNRPVANSGTSTYLFISNRGWPIDRRTLLVMMKKKYSIAAGLPPNKGLDSSAALPMGRPKPGPLLAWQGVI